MKKVKISLKTLTLNDGVSDEQAFEYDGEYDFKNGAHYLKYSEITEGARVATVIKATEKSAVITRTGAVGSVLKVEKGSVHKTEYKTPYGVFSLAVKGDEYKNLLAEGKEITLCYTLFNEGGVIGQNKIEINIKEV